jgi:phosphoglycerate kinase
MELRTLLDVKIIPGMHVLIRIDSDVAIARGKMIGEAAFRLDAALPTLKFLLKKKAIITVMGHRGRPAGKKIAALSLGPVQKYLEARLKTKLTFLPNTRFDIREEKNDLAYARELAMGQEFFVNESFATAHRAHASCAAITKILPSCAGLQFEKEVRELSRLNDARAPLVLIIGGAKIETKIPLIQKFVHMASHIFIVGAAANAFFVAQGISIGGSYVDADSVTAARRLLKYTNIFLPVDVIIGSARSGKKFSEVTHGDLQRGEVRCAKTDAILDAGPATILMMSEVLARSQTIIWNGPAGIIERPPFDLGTERIARLLARAGRGGAQIVAGGGETVTSILHNKMSRGFAHISTGGGAMLAFLGGAKMPVLDALKQK